MPIRSGDKVQAIVTTSLLSIILDFAHKILQKLFEFRIFILTTPVRARLLDSGLVLLGFGLLSPLPRSLDDLVIIVVRLWLCLSLALGLDIFIGNGGLVRLSFLSPVRFRCLTLTLIFRPGGGRGKIIEPCRTDVPALVRFRDRARFHIGIYGSIPVRLFTDRGGRRGFTRPRGWARAGLWLRLSFLSVSVWSI